MTHIIRKMQREVEPRAVRATPVTICVGAHWTFVSMQVEGEATPCAGIASTLSGGSDDHHHGGGPPVREAGHLLDLRAEELVAMAASESLLEASVGLAAINALLDVDEQACVELNAADVIAEHGAGKKVAVVGHFPFVPRLREIADTLWVLELNPGTGDLPAEEASQVLPRSDVVALTGTSLLNGTFDGLVDLCRPDAYVIVLGATTPVSPAFFTVGVDAVSGTRIVDPASALTAVSQGATFRQIPGKRLLTMFREGS